jgi:hypothetical protein
MRTLKAGNHRHSPKAMRPAFEWLGQVNHEGNMLIFVNTHSDSDTGNLVVSGNEANPTSIPIFEVGSVTCIALTHCTNPNVHSFVATRRIHWQ